MFSILDKFKEQRYGQVTIKGYSVSAVRTGFYSSKLGIHFDAGMGSYVPVNHICLTHGHADHSQHLVPLMMPGPNQTSITKVLCHKEIVESVKNLVEASLNEIIGIDEHSEYCYSHNGTNYKIVGIKCFHDVPTIGFGFYEFKTKLMPHAIDKIKSLVGSKSPSSLKEIKQIKQDENNLTTYCEPIFAYICDTDKRVFEMPIKQFPVIMIECTFLESIHLKDNLHISFNDLNTFAKQNSSAEFIAFHFSKRYSDVEIAKHFRTFAANNLKYHTNKD